MNSSTVALKSCPICQASQLERVVEISGIPVHCNFVHATEQAARQCLKGPLELSRCTDCGHFFNSAYDPKLLEYDQRYENSLHFSPTFNRYAEGLALDLVRRLKLYKKGILEIGCGQGTFLKMICRAGQNRGLGFDPSYRRTEVSNPNGADVSIRSEAYCGQALDFYPDLVCARQLLEHVPAPVQFLKALLPMFGRHASASLFIEVPNGLFTIRDLGVWDLIYEHYSYFCECSLVRAFAEAGYQVVGLRESYGGQYLQAEARLRNGQISPERSERESEKMKRLASGFAASYRNKINKWTDFLSRCKADGKRVALWGAGSKGVMFLNLVGQGLVTVVDINSRKQGMFVACTGQRIVGPEFLKTSPPDVILVMNSMYGREIGQATAELGLAADLVFA